VDEEVKLVYEVKQEVGSRGEATPIDLQRICVWWTIEYDNRTGTSISGSLKRDETAQVGRLTGGENFNCK